MSNSPPPKRQRISSPAASGATPAVTDAQHVPAPIAPIAPKTPLDTIPPVPTPPSTAPVSGISPTSPVSPSSPNNPRKRRLSRSPKLNTLPPGTSLPSESSARESSASVPISTLLTGEPGKKRGRTNTPWTAAEEQRLKHMRDSGNSWGDIAKSFPNRTEGSVKKHWYKDMHYAEFAEDESAALRDAIKEYEANKWKAIGQKLGKPAKACEQYAKEHFKNL